MKMVQNITRDGLSSEQRTEIFRRQMIVERDRLEIGHAMLQMVDLGGELPADALKFRLDADEAASADLEMNGKTGPMLVVKIPADGDENGVIEIFDWDEYRQPMAEADPDEDALMHLTDLGFATSDLNVQMAKRMIHRAKGEAIREYRKTLGGDQHEPPIVTEQTVPAAQHANSVQSAPLGGDPALSNLSASQAAHHFIDANPRTGGADGTARKRGPSWTSKTRDQFKLPALLLEQVMDGRPLASVTQADLMRLHGCFNGLHGPSFRKSARQREMTILEVVAETDRLVLQGEIQASEVGLGVSTANRHWGFLRQLTNWFGRHHPIAQLDYSAFIIDDDRDPRTLRDTYTVVEGRALFSLPPWTGSVSARRRMDAGRTVVHDAFFFVPLIAWYTGLRREEICGLMLDDLVEEADGHWHFAIRDNNVRKLKTKSSARLVPMADELVRLGLSDYVKALRSEGEILLFPELASESGKGTMGDAYYKTCWIKMAGHLNFLERGQAMHAFRHTVADELKAQSVSVEERADLVGHRLQSETSGRYSKAARLDVMRAVVAKIPVVTDHLAPTPLNLRPAKDRQPRTARAKARV